MILKSVSIDCVIFGFDGASVKVLLSQQNPDLLRRKIEEQDDYEDVRVLYDSHPNIVEPDCWSVFGAHVPVDKGIDDYARELLFLATGMNNVFLKQFHCFGDVERVPQFRVITVGYYALINPANHMLRKSIVTNDLKWFGLNDLPKLPFDHETIIHHAIEHLRHEVRYQPIGFHLLPENFTLTEFQSLYEVILDKKMDIRNFRKKIAKMELLIDTQKKQKNVSHRAARLYKFDEKVYNRLKEEGFRFRIE